MCGFVGVISLQEAAPQLYLGLQAIQHRGQDAAGIGTFANGKFHLHKDLGLISQAIPAETLDRMPGRSGISHVRYPTAGVGIGDREDAQPFLTRRPGILMAHNGNVTNQPEVEAALADRGLHVMSNCDSEPILLVLADELTKIRPARHTEDDLVVAVGALMKRIRGAYSVVAVLEIDGRETLIAFRDPHGIRPAVYGRHKNGGWMVASESVALDVLGYQVVGHVPPGAMVILRAGDAAIVRNVEPQSPKHCVFERIYFARPDSLMEGGRVNALRWALGERLADDWAKKGLEADVVVAIPDTSRDAASAMAERLGIPNREGFIKNRYSGRTFIMPNQATREAALRLKLNPIPEVFDGKRVILVDDSIVRGSTMRRIVAMVKELRPAEVHLAIFSPPVRHPCFYGIDMPSRDELVASQFAPGELESRLADALGVQSLTYITPDALREVAGDGMCTACFTGDYVVPVSNEERGYILKNRSVGETRVAVAPAAVR
jgi:amidophosphoribosyltransferase